MEIIKPQQWQRPRQESFAQIRNRVREMIAEIETTGDEAIERFSLDLDGFIPTRIDLQPWDEYGLDSQEKAHIALAAARIERFCSFQRSMYRDMEMTDACGRYGHRIVPLDSMAAYIPAGRFPLISTTLMTLIPAAVAGVTQRLAVSPSRAPHILAAASLAGATAFLQLGGAQAIAAVALGSRHHGAVDIVVGPGNAYVTAAKGLLQDRVKIDALAGPSELLVLCDGSAPARWLAMDLMAQAEHDPLALSILASTSLDCLREVRDLVEREQRRSSSEGLGLVSLVHAQNAEALVDFANRVAPEHLLLACAPEFLPIAQLRHFGSLFVGAQSTVAFGDYTTGPNHTLPTSGHARRQGGLQVGDFLRVLTYQELADHGVGELAPTAAALAAMEGLSYHKRSIEVRLED